MYERNLEAIEIKVRRYTGRLSEERLSTVQLREFIFETMRYDLCEDLHFSKVKTTWDLITIPNVGVYDLTKMVIPDPFGNDTVRVINLYEDFFPPAKIGSDCVTWEQEPCQTNQYRDNQKEKTISGVGNAGPYQITIDKPIIQGNVLLYTQNSFDDPVFYKDVPNNKNFGYFTKTTEIKNIDGFVNYLEGTVEVTFPDAISTDQTITIQYNNYKPGKPTHIYFDGTKFHLTPIPDGVYKITICVYKNPIRLLIGTDSPEVDKWSDYIALNTARRILSESDNHDAIERFEKRYRQEIARITYRYDQQIKAKLLNPRNVYSNNGCGSCCNYDPCGMPKNPFNRRCCR